MMFPCAPEPSLPILKQVRRPLARRHDHRAYNLGDAKVKVLHGAARTCPTYESIHSRSLIGRIIVSLILACFSLSITTSLCAQELLPFPTEKVEAEKLETFRKAIVARLKKTEICNVPLLICEYQDTDRSAYFVLSTEGNISYPAIAIIKIDINSPFFKGMAVTGYYASDEKAYRQFLEYAKKRGAEIYDKIQLVP